MCIVADAVDNVWNTTIASFHVGYSYDSGKTIVPSQLIVYSASVESSTNTNAFILPVHNLGNDPKKIIPLDFSDLPDFLDDVKSIFNRWFPDTYTKNHDINTNNMNFKSNNLLEVHKVGDYQFSIMPTKYDFNRIDQSKLNINPTAKVSIDVHSDNYSFIIYQFYQKGKLNITPFGYLCPPITENTMFVPTIHGHQHDNLPALGIGYVPNMFINYKPEFENEAEFDHEIYGLVKNTSNKKIINNHDIKDIDNLLKKINLDYTNQPIRVYSPRDFYPKKLRIKGRKINRNIELNPDGHRIINDLVAVSARPATKNPPLRANWPSDLSPLPQF